MKQIYMQKTICLLALLGSSLMASQETSGLTDSLRTIEVLESGFFKRDTLSITFNVNDQTIVAVRDNGKDILPNNLSKYNITVNHLLDLEEWEELRPRVDELKNFLDNKSNTPEKKMARIESMQVELASRDMEMADLYLGLFEQKWNLLVYQIMRREVLSLAASNGDDLRGQPLEIELTHNGVNINGTAAPATDAQAFLNIYNRYFPNKLLPGVTINFILDN